MNIRLLGQSLHVEGHLLLVDELSDIDDERVDIVPAVLFLEQARGARKAFGALRLSAEILDGLGWMFGAADLVVQFLRTFDLNRFWLDHQL